MSRQITGYATLYNTPCIQLDTAGGAFKLLDLVNERIANSYSSSGYRKLAFDSADSVPTGTEFSSRTLSAQEWRRVS